MTRTRWLARLLVLVLIAGACSDNGDSLSASYGKSTVTLPDARVLSVLVADTGPLRQRGLSGVTELAGYDGMLFTFPDDTDTQFWMKDTKIPLDIAFMAADGTVLSAQTMPLCVSNDDNCARYGPTSSYRYALEAPAGSFARWKLTAGSHLQIG